jgi:hypothetical protein
LVLGAVPAALQRLPMEQPLAARRALHPSAPNTNAGVETY